MKKKIEASNPQDDPAGDASKQGPVAGPAQEAPRPALAKVIAHIHAASPAFRAADNLPREALHDRVAAREPRPGPRATDEPEAQA